MTAFEPQPLRPRRTVHHGTIDARGYWFDSRFGRAGTLERRVLAAWLPGAEVYALDEGYLVLLRSTLRLCVEASPAALLVLDAGVLTSAPLLARERKALSEHAELVLVDGGVARTLCKSELKAVDIVDWLDVSAFEVLDARPLGALPDTPPTVVAAPDTQALFDAKIGRTDADRARQRELLGALEAMRQLPGRPGRASSPVLDYLRTAWAGLSRRARSKLQSGAGKPRRLEGASPPARVQAPPKVSLFERFRAAMARWISGTRLMSLLASKQAAYLRELLELLAAHDDLEVLRRAIPLGKGSEAGVPTPALSPPTPRGSFEISLSARQHGSAMVLYDNLYERLRRSYESVFDRLNNQGKHEEAAFFLAEILNEPERAVAYLEQHGRLKLAAELAEARKLAPGLVVRLWFLAGDHKRAVAIAVREQAFADAIDRLERSGKKEQAAALRLLQAERLAQGGRYVAAARLVEKMIAAHPLALRWLELGRVAGDLKGVALELSLDAGRFEPVRVALAPLRVDPSPDGVRLRVLVAEELMRANVPVGKPLARELTREILADAATLGDAALAHTAGKIAAWIGGAFDADQPSVATFARRTPSEPVRYRYAAADCGSRPIFDACVSGARFLVALGEAGVALVNRAGKQLAHFNLPAEHLVTSGDGARVLAVTRRGNALRAGRIDLGTRRSDHWGEIRALAFARTFDGQTWVVANWWLGDGDSSELLLLDALDASPTVLRRIEVPIAPGADGGIQLDERHCNLVGSVPFGPLERLRFELPSWTLRERKQVELKNCPEKYIFMGACVATRADPPVLYQHLLDQESGMALPPSLRRGDHEVPLPPLDITGSSSLQAHGDHFALALLEKNCARVLVGNFATRAVLLDIELEGTTKLELRLSDSGLLVCDDRGRLLSFDLASVRCIHDLRL